jgi:pseudaminic acid biosynthesis-associated methylase
MNSRKYSPQEQFWKGDFGDDYINRNNSDELLKAKTEFWSGVLQNKIEQIKSAIELGANVGLNLTAIKSIFKSIDTFGVEINKRAFEEMERRGHQGENLPVLDFHSKGVKWDLVLVNGVLIHQNPDHLNSFYNKIAEVAAKYVIIGESFSSTPEAVTYRGHKDKYFKRDFAGEFIDQNPGFEIESCFFAYRRININYDDSLVVVLRKIQE